MDTDREVMPCEDEAECGVVMPADHQNGSGSGGEQRTNRYFLRLQKESNPNDTLLLDFSLSELRDNKCLLFKLPSQYPFAGAALANQ